MPTPEDMLSEIGTPSVYPHRYEPARARVLMIRMREADYRAASFLDDRMLTGETEGAWVPYARAAEAAAALAGAKPLHFIFHLGHVGSTLLSRLLDEIPGVLSLREPLPLRTLAEGPEAGALDTFLRLWSRGFESTRAVVLKATSSAARIAPQLLAARPPGVRGTPSTNGARAVYMYLAAEPYLATLLAGENSPLDLKGHEAERTARLAAHLRTPVPPVTSLGELAALSWLAERMTMAAVMPKFPGRVLALDFGAMLADVGGALARVASHFNLQIDAARLAAAAKSAVLTRYSKAPDYEYTPAFRDEILAQSRRDNADEIAKGLAWLARLGGKHAAVSALL